jgi:putative transposase
MRYIERNPVRARVVSDPGEFPWSRFRANACGASDDFVVPHPIYRSLGRSRGERQGAYRELFRSTFTESDLCSIRDATQNAWALGNEASRRRVEASSRRPERLPMGRPRRKPAAPDKSRV